MELFQKCLFSLVNVISSLFIYGAIVVFLHCFYDPGFLWHKKKTLLVSLSLLVQLPIIAFLPAVANGLTLPFLAADLAIILYDYQGKWYKGVFRWLWVFILIVFCFTMIVMAGFQYILPDVFSFMDPEFLEQLANADIVEMEKLLESMEPVLTSFETNWQFFTMGVGIVVFGPVFFYLYFRVYKRGIVMKCQKREFVFVTVYVVLCTAASIVLAAEVPLSYGILGVCFILVAALLPIFVYYLRISRHYQERIKHQELYMQAELEHFQQYKQQQEETSRFRHDLQNNLLCMDQLLSQGKDQEAAEYLKGLLEITENLRPKYVTGDEILDSILGVKSDMMTKNGIDFQLDGVLAGGLSWKSVDVCTVFANGLDNAVEACLKLPPERRKINMVIKATPRFWLVRIENPVQTAVDTGKLFRKSGSYTSKADGNHGIGTYNMKHTVEKYGGMIKAECADEQFTLEIMIDKSRA